MLNTNNFERFSLIVREADSKDEKSRGGAES